VQWVVFALLGLGFPVWLRRRQREAAEQDAAAGDAQPVPAHHAGRPAATAATAAPAARAAPAGPPARPRRRRIWDADDEDEEAMRD
jgi:hypothetical protein